MNRRRRITTTNLKSPTLQLRNHQRRDPVPIAWLRAQAACALRALRIHREGMFSVAFVDGRTMRALNRRFTGHAGLTDVLSFRYQGERIIGEILIAPEAARRYATAHNIPYRIELARYVVHGLLHWLGHEDRTPTQQRRMRRMEDRLLAKCSQGVR